MEGEGEAPHVQKSMERKGEGSHVRRRMEGEGESSLLAFLIFPPMNFIQTFHFFLFSLILTFYFIMVLGRYLRLSSLSLAYKLWSRIWCHKFSAHSLLIRFGWKSLLFSLEIMVSRMAMFYKLQVAQANEEPTPESSLDLTLTQHLHDEKPKSWKVHAHLKINPPQAWYYRISPNSRTLVILLQVDPSSNDELETICENCYETENTSIFAWSSIPGIRHYR